MAGLYKRGAIWWVRYRTAAGARKRESTGCRRRANAERVKVRIEERVEQERAGIADPYVAAAKQPIEDHVQAWARSLRCSERQQADLVAGITRFVDGMEIRRLPDVDLDAAERWLEREAARGLSVTTINHRRGHLRQWTRWLSGPGQRLPYDPLSGLMPYRAEGEDAAEPYRRALRWEELESLLDVSPLWRRVAYALASTVGLRRREIRLLRWDDVDLEELQLTVRAPTAKGRKLSHLPITEEVAGWLRRLRDREEERDELRALNVVLEPGPFAPGPIEERTETAAAVHRRTGIAPRTLRRYADQGCPYSAAGRHRLYSPEEVLRWREHKGLSGRRGGYRRTQRTEARREHLVRLLEAPLPDRVLPRVPTVDRLFRDLRAAGIEPETEAGRVDLHALRTTFGTLMARAGVPLVVAQRLMRHSTPDLTARYYTRVESADQRQAVSVLWGRLTESGEGGELLRWRA